MQVAGVSTDRPYHTDRPSVGFQPRPRGYLLIMPITSWSCIYTYQSTQNPTGAHVSIVDEELILEHLKQLIILFLSFSFLQIGKIGQLQSLQERGSPNITPSLVSLPEYHVLIELSDYHTYCVFLVRMQSLMLVLGSCITLPIFELFVCVTSQYSSCPLCHQLVLSLHLSHSVQFFLSIILAIFAC